MSLAEGDWQYEQRRIEHVNKLLNQRIEQLELEVGLVKGVIVDIRKNFWDGITINLGNPDDMGETFFSVKQQADVVSERERTHKLAVVTLDKLKRLLHSPYFGRIDFVEQDTSDVESIYLGIVSLLDGDGITFLIYDWRAPIASLYYDYPPGLVKYETPNGEVKGEMLLKRQYMIRDGIIELMFDTSVTIGDQLLQKVLGHSSEAQMKSIVATIQREQNQIIRNESSRMLLVQGVAGSGKTSAALQRVAYLLYKHRLTLKADQMLLFSPNPMFNSYVSTVLPELGEENMQQTTFQQYLEHRLNEEYQLEDPFEQLETILSAEEQTVEYKARLAGIRFKSSIGFYKVILAYKEILQRQDILFKPLVFRGRNIVSMKRMKERFYSYDSAIRLANRIELHREWLLKELNVFEEKEWRENWVDDEVQHLDFDDYHYSFKKLRSFQKGKSATFDDYDKQYEVLARMVVQEKLNPLRHRIQSLRFVDVLGLYRQLFKENQSENIRSPQVNLPDNWNDICQQTLLRLEKLELAYEDATPFLLIKELVHGYQSNHDIRYVIIDEVQDYSAFQLEFIKHLFPRSKMTALGDLNQAIYAHASILHEYQPIMEMYGAAQTDLIRLVNSYRSTREIVEFTRGIVQGENEIMPFNRPGDKPLIITVQDQIQLHNRIQADVAAFLNRGYASIAIICKTAKESEIAFEALQDRLPLLLITKHTLLFEKGIQVIPAYLAKGVEFDAVILYNGSKELYRRENERKLFYTACTRAMHELFIYSLGEWSPFLTALDASTYERKVYIDQNVSN
ncbi:MAG: RNA polymerase recycling motor HelD [Paenibacillaceae bacterium]